MQLTMELRGVERMVARHAELERDLKAELLVTMREVGREVRSEMKAAAPKFTGALQQGIRMRSSSRRMSVVVKAHASHSWLVEHGRGGGKMPSVDPSKAANPKSAQRLLDWAKAHNINPFILARAIARKGTQAHPFSAGPIERGKAAFEFEMQAAVDRVLAKYR